MSELGHGLSALTLIISITKAVTETGWCGKRSKFLFALNGALSPAPPTYAIDIAFLSHFSRAHHNFISFFVALRFRFPV